MQNVAAAATTPQDIGMYVASISQFSSKGSNPRVLLPMRLVPTIRVTKRPAGIYEIWELDPGELSVHVTCYLTVITPFLFHLSQRRRYSVHGAQMWWGEMSVDLKT